MLEYEDLEFNSPDFPKIDRRIVLKKFDSGEIRIEQGADGAYLLFDCDCLDALPYCQAQCCGLRGIGLSQQEEDKFGNTLVEWDHESGMAVMIRGADGFCNCLDRKSRTCTIYEERPNTCKQFHCTKGARVRGWKLSNSVNTHSFS